MKRALSVVGAVAISTLLAACPRGDTSDKPPPQSAAAPPAEAPDPGPSRDPSPAREPAQPGTETAAEQTATESAALAAETPKRPALPGDPRHGWALFKEHCTVCHGATRRGTGAYRSHLPVPPADLRDPILLASRTNDQLTKSILYGVSRKGGERVPSKPGSKKDMPAFSKELGEQDVLDVISFLRGDSIYLEECGPRGSYFLEIKRTESEPGPKIFGIHTAPGTQKGGIVTSAAELPAGARQIGYVTFAELELPGAGSTPVAFVANLGGEIQFVRVALPEPDNERARKDIEAGLKGGVDAAPKLRSLIGDLEAMKSMMKTAVKS